MTMCEMLKIHRKMETANKAAVDKVMGRVPSYKNVTAKPVCSPKIIHQPEETPDYPYNVQLWYSHDGGKTFCYSGCGRFFRDEESASDFCRRTATPTT